MSHRGLGVCAALVLTAALAACQSAPPPAAPAADTSAAPATTSAPAPAVKAPPAPPSARPAAPSKKATAARTPIDWPALQRAVGTYDADTHFLRAPGLNARLRTLLGARYATVMRNLEVAGPLEVDGGTYSVTGNRAHMGGIESVAIAMQPASDTVRVWLLHQGREQVIEEGRNAFPWPRDVQTMISNQARRR